MHRESAEEEAALKAARPWRDERFYTGGGGQLVVEAILINDIFCRLLDFESCIL